MRAICVQERRSVLTAEAEAADAPGAITLKEAVVRYTVASAVASAVVIAAGVAMPFAAVRLAAAMGWGQSFVGTFLVAAATSLPEAASTIGALKLGAIDLAIGNLFGSNLFNILILAIDDLVYVKGPLLAHASPSHALSSVSAIMMTGVAIVGLHYRPALRVFAIAGWGSLALLLTYILNSLMLYLHGH